MVFLLAQMGLSVIRFEMVGFASITKIIVKYVWRNFNPSKKSKL